MSRLQGYPEAAVESCERGVMVQLVSVYVVILLITTILALVVAAGAWVQRESSTTRPVVALMLGVSVWCGTEAALWSSRSLNEQAFWLRLTYPAVSLTVVSLAVFAFAIAGLDSWLAPKRIALLVIPNALLCIAALTNPSSLFYAGYTAQQIGSHTHYVAQNGPLFWAYIVVAYGTMLVGFGVLIRASIRSTPQKRVQITIVLVGASIPYIVSIANQLSSVQIEGIESTAFFLTGVIFLIALIRGRLLDSSGRIVTGQQVRDIEQREHELQVANRQLGSELAASKNHVDRLFAQANRDPLTDLSNRRALEGDLGREIANSRRTDEPVALVMLDLDHFKAINETYSHMAGDEALKAVSQILLLGTSENAIVGRWESDQFLIVMPGTDEEAACRQAEQLREAINAAEFHFGGRRFTVTATFGVSVFPEHGATSKLAILAADRALHHAKRSGGNHQAVAGTAGLGLYN
jgi:diguanylate cyclase (GGDEF)-like protein